MTRPYMKDETKKILAKFELRPLNTISPTSEYFCIADSTLYMNKMFRLMAQADVDETLGSEVVALATAYKSRHKIIMALDMAFTGHSWYRELRGFFTNKVCEFVNEETERTIPVSFIPLCAPSVAARAWLQLTESPTVEDFLQNEWVGGIDLDPALLKVRKTCETDFWPGDQEHRRHRQPLLNSDGKIFAPGNSGYYCRMDVMRWFGTRTKHVKQSPGRYP